jgi:hypothetical protein
MCGFIVKSVLSFDAWVSTAHLIASRVGESEN